MSVCVCVCVCACVDVFIRANLDAVAVAVHVELGAARNAASLDHRLEVRHVLHVPVHVGRQYLQPISHMPCRL